MEVPGDKNGRSNQCYKTSRPNCLTKGRTKERTNVGTDGKTHERSNEPANEHNVIQW